MDLEKYFVAHPKLSILAPSDQEPALKLCSQSPMKMAGIELTYERGPDFQALLRCQSPDHLTIVSRKPGATHPHDNPLHLIFSVSETQKWLGGKLVNCGYIGDFRTDQSRTAAKIWREYYVEVLRAWKNQASPPKYILTAILKKNADAFRNLVNPKRDLGYRYRPLCEVDMVNIYGRLPWAKKALLETRFAAEEDRLALLDFLAKREKEKAFGSLFDGSSRAEWSHRLKSWKGFSVENFLLQKDATGRIIACTLPWDPGFAKRMRVTKAPSRLRWLFRIFKFIGYHLPNEGDSLKTLYLTHLNFSPELDPVISLNAMLCFLDQQNLGFHMISFADPHRWSSRMGGWLKQKIPVSVFSVDLTEDPSSNPGLPEGQAISFEMGLV